MLLPDFSFIFELRLPPLRVVDGYRGGSYACDDY